jgi:hypothetical protein
MRSDLVEFTEQYSVDSDFSYRYLEQLIINWRVKWFQNTYEKFNRGIPSVYYQTIQCLDMEIADQSECCDIVTGCSIVRSVKEVPPFMTLSDGEVFTKAWPVSVQTDTNNLFDIIKFERADTYGNLRYNGNRIGAFIYNNRIYLISKDDDKVSLVDKINIRGVYRDPRDVGKFHDCSSKPCWTDEAEFPLEERLWTYMFNDLKETILKKLDMPQDFINNAKSGLQSEQE